MNAALNLWVVLNRAHRAIRRHAEADMERHGLTPTEFGILEALFHKGPVLLGELQKKILVSSGGVTYLVDRLTDKGLVERAECEGDRRAKYVRLTKTGTALISKIFPAHEEVINRALNGLSRKEQQEAAALIKTLGLAAEAMEQA
ncbi:MAG: MarR family transcriptional regulator [Gemmatimonadales bacterium]